MQHIGRMDVLESSGNLVHEVSYVVLAQSLSLEKLVKVGLHESLHYVHILHCLVGLRAQDVQDVDDLEE